MNRPGMKSAAFTVRADVRQSARWKRAAEAEGFPSVEAWAALTLDAYLELRMKAEMPVPLAWRSGRFAARLEGGELVTVKGHLSPPFGAFEGSAAQPGGVRRPAPLLPHLPSGRPDLGHDADLQGVPGARRGAGAGLGAVGREGTAGSGSNERGRLREGPAFS